MKHLCTAHVNNRDGGGGSRGSSGLCCLTPVIRVRLSKPCPRRHWTSAIPGLYTRLIGNDRVDDPNIVVTTKQPTKQINEKCISKTTSDTNPVVIVTSSRRYVYTTITTVIITIQQPQPQSRNGVMYYHRSPYLLVIQLQYG